MLIQLGVTSIYGIGVWSLPVSCSFWFIGLAANSRKDAPGNISENDKLWENKDEMAPKLAAFCGKMSPVAPKAIHEARRKPFLSEILSVWEKKFRILTNLHFKEIPVDIWDNRHCRFPLKKQSADGMHGHNRNFLRENHETFHNNEFHFSHMSIMVIVQTNCSPLHNFSKHTKLH